MRAITLSLAIALTVLATGCSDDDSTSAGGEAGADDTGTVAVSLEEVDGFFIEGFEIGLRFETAAGERIDAVLWSDVVAAEGRNDLEAYYDTVLEQQVPAGDVVVLATVNVGIGPPPETPDLDGDLRCRLPVTVPVGGRVEVEVGFSDPGDCLTEIG